MKKFTFSLICIILATGAAMAQKQFTFGPKIGVDYTHFWGKYVENNKGLFNYQAGLFMEYRFTDKFSIAPEVVFAAQGDKVDAIFLVFDEITGLPIDTEEGTITYKTNYINVPVMLKYYVIPSLSIDLGPQLGINVYSKEVDKSPSYNETIDYKNLTKTIDFGVALGLTYNITDDVFVQGRYTLGVTDVFEKDNEYKNGNAQIAIGYRF